MRLDGEKRSLAKAKNKTGQRIYFCPIFYQLFGFLSRISWRMIHHDAQRCILLRAKYRAVPHTVAERISPMATVVTINGYASVAPYA